MFNMQQTKCPISKWIFALQWQQLWRIKRKRILIIFLLSITNIFFRGILFLRQNCRKLKSWTCKSSVQVVAHHDTSIIYLFNSLRVSALYFLSIILGNAIVKFFFLNAAIQQYLFRRTTYQNIHSQLWLMILGIKKKVYQLAVRPMFVFTIPTNYWTKEYYY